MPSVRPRIVGQSVPPPLPPSVGGSSDEDEESYPSIPRNTGDERTPNQLESADWRTDLRTQLAKDLRAVADDLGQPSFVLDNWMDEQFDVMLNYLYAQGFIAREEDFNASVDVLVPGGGSLTIGDMGDQRFEDLNRTPTVGGKYNPFSIEGLSAIYQASLLWVGAQIPGFNQIRGNTQAGGGSGGSRGPTAQDIRNSMDEDQLTQAASNLWQTYLIEENPDARRIAKDYINEIVATKGQKKLDFETFVMGRIKKTGRYAALYRNKDEGVSELQYLQPFVQTAMSALGGKKGAVHSVAAEGAILGSDPASFAARLQREDAVRNSSGFISGLEERVRGLNNVLRG